MATHSSILAWKIPRAEEPGRLQSLGPQRVRHNWVTEYTFLYYSITQILFTIAVENLCFVLANFQERFNDKVTRQSYQNLSFWNLPKFLFVCTSICAWDRCPKFQHKFICLLPQKVLCMVSVKKKKQTNKSRFVQQCYKH